MSAFELKPATRQGVILLIELWGGTGGGKTESALRLARGLAGPDKRVGIIDTEHKRASYCIDRIPGGFHAIDFPAPYSPERYLEALNVLEQNADVAVVDSISHLWDAEDGILDLHEQALDKMTRGSTDWKERERLNWPAWREPKTRYKAVRNKLLGFKIPLIICCRGEEKTHLEKDGSRNVVVTDKTTTPIFDKKFVFETHIALEVCQIDGKGGFIRYTPPFAKVSHADIRDILPEPGKGQLTVEIGERLAAWANEGPTMGRSKPQPGAKPPAESNPDAHKKAKTRLWNATSKKVKATGEPEIAEETAWQNWLWGNWFMMEGETIATCTPERLEQIIVKILE